jgi:hypothetical protein
MPFLPRWTLSGKFWWLLAPFSACALLAIWQISQRPDQIRPHIYGSGIDRDNMEPVDVTIYEYTDRENWITNGRSITLRIPIAYLTFSAALAGGAQAEISMDFDYETGEPWTRRHSSSLRDQHAAEAPKSSDANRFYPGIRRMSATLSVLHRPFGERQAKGLLAAKLGKPDWLYKNYVYLNQSICDYDMFRNQTIHGTKHLVPPHYPFDRATTFARRDVATGYDTIVECVALNEHAWCRATREFEGFPLTIHFDGSRLCKVDAVFDHAVQVLNGLVVQRTSAVEGWGSKD